LLTLTTLASGSAGNATLVTVNGIKCLLDCGGTKKQLVNALAIHNINIPDIDYLFISHNGHRDHSSNLKYFTYHARLHETTTTNDKTFTSLSGKGFCVGIPADHDVPCRSFVIGDTEGNKMAYITDTRTIPCDSLPYFIGCNIIHLEANHDTSLLLSGPYPDDLKIRVSETHLENRQSREFLELVNWPGLKYVIAGHLSEKNNNPELVRYELEHGVKDAEILIAQQDEATRAVTVI